MEVTHQMVVLRCSTTVPGALSAMTTGISVTLKWSVDSSASLGQKVLSHSHTSEVELVRHRDR